jgi:dTDP-4-dehydrorhamnose reductase
LQLRVLVVGGNSKIATSLIKELTRRGDIVFQTSRRDKQHCVLFLDLLNVDTFLKSGQAPEVDVVVICAGVTKFEDCRDENPEVRSINVDAPALIARYYSLVGVRVILLSTSAVFNGTIPYEKAATLPNSTNGYGKLKAEAEKAVLTAGANNAVLRLSKILTPDNQLFRNWAGSLREGKKVKAFTDQFISPITLPWAIRTILAIIDDKENGIYQFSAKGDISYFKAAQHLAKYLNVDTIYLETEKASEKEIPENEIANYNSLDSSRLEKLLSTNAPDSIHELDIFFKEIFP